MLNGELRKKIVEENYYYDLLNSNQQYRLQGYSLEDRKCIVGIITGNPKEYKETDKLKFKGFDTWKEAYTQLS